MSCWTGWWPGHILIHAFLAAKCRPMWPSRPIESSSSLMSTQTPHITQHHLSTTVAEQDNTAALPPFSTPWLSFLLTLFHCASSTLFHNPSQSVLYVDLKTKQNSNVFKMCFFKKKNLCCIFNGNEKWIHEMWEKRKKLKSGLSGVVSQRLRAEQMGRLRLCAECIMRPRSWGGNV